MRIKGLLRQFLSVELLLIWLLKGTVSSFLLSNHNGIFRLNYPNSLVTPHLFQLALLGLSLPRTILGDSIASATRLNKKSRKVQNSTTTTSKPKRRRKSKNLPQKQTTANNALLANIDFLTQLTNSKHEKNAEMDPLKCFPKALCGLSAESAAITRRRKNGLISDYIRLMKAVALNPSVMDKTLRKLKKKEHDQLQDETVKDSTESEEDREDDDDDDDEEEDEESEHGRHSSLNKRTDNYGYGYGPTSPSNQEAKVEQDGPAKKRTKRKQIIPKDSAEFTKQFLQEKAHVERLIEDGFFNEETESQNWWAYEKDHDPALEELVDFSGTTLDSTSAESFYTFGGKRKPDPPIPPNQPDQPMQPEGPGEPPMMMEPQAPPRLKPPPAPVIRVPESSNYGSSGTVSKIGNFLRSLFGFGSSSNDAGSFSNDAFFQGFQRSLPDGTPTVVTVDKTKEILTTAIEIGETLRSPHQCNSLFNGCKYQYIELLHVIDDIRESLGKRGKENSHSSFYTGLDEENDSGAKADETFSSYGYQSSLSETSQAETLSPDYTGAASAVTQKNKQQRKKKKSSFRGETVSSTSRETSVEIGSDEQTMYGSGQQNFDFHQYNKHGHSYGPHNHRNQPSHYNHHQQSGSYQPSYQFEEMNIRQPKTIWGTILSWFGFR